MIQQQNKFMKLTALALAVVFATTTAACGIGGGATSDDGRQALPEMPAESMAPADPAARENFYTAPNDMQLDGASNAYFATIETNKGTILVELWPEVAPQHVNNFVFLANSNYYDGLLFHRVVPDFVIQGGDPTGTGGGGPGYTIPGEFNAENPVPHRIGTLAMARTADPDSAGSQWYIVNADSESAANLTGQYTNFGHVVSGMAVVQQIVQGDVMNSVDVAAAPKSDSIVSPDEIRGGLLPENQ